MSNEEFLAQLQDIRNATLLQNKEIYNTEEACLFLGIKKNSLYDLVKRERLSSTSRKAESLLTSSAKTWRNG